MRTRPGVSLVEVLVAALLLAVGVGGSVQTVVTAGRLRAHAAARDRLARVVEARLLWFQGRSCTAPDTTVDSALPRGMHERWHVGRSGGMSRLEGRARSGGGADSLRLALAAQRRCP